jgi:ferrous iron transport protein B
MRNNKVITVALVGNPNTGKTSLFNQLTGLNQKVGNYPGITVDRMEGFCKLNDTKCRIIDLPGTYSINPNTIDESIVLDTLINKENPDHPDIVVVVADINNLKRNLFLFTQVKDLGIQTILAINMADEMEKKGISIDLDTLQKELKSDVVLLSARKNTGIDELRKRILNPNVSSNEALANFSERMDKEFFKKIKNNFKELPLYKAWLYITQCNDLSIFNEDYQKKIEKLREDENKLSKLQHRETVLRYQFINNILKNAYKKDPTKATDLRSKLDKILMHRIFGYILFLLILFIIFQSVFSLAQTPMDFIDSTFTKLNSFVKSKLPEGVLTSLITDGIIPGIGGIVIFIPQIVILFFMVAILEETGYMSRVVFLMDKIMRRFGLSGKSVVPLISGTACSIPAIMAARNISGWKERLITVLVTPFVTCSARIPVYAIIIALIIPKNNFYGIGLQGLTLFMLYFLGFAAALISAYILNKILKVKNKSYFVIEMPNYKIPSIKNVFYTIIEKTKAFVFGAGKIILAISIILWFLATNGPSNTFDKAENIVEKELKLDNKILSETEKEQKLATYKLEHSYIGIIGKSIEPAIKPLGYDWKIGIALVTSFAAREVFVGTLATIYSVENLDDEKSIAQRLSAEINTETGKKLFNFPVGMSLLIFYAFAMQCMSTLAIVRRETKTWKWPLYQLFGMTAIAYVFAFLTYTILK